MSWFAWVWVGAVDELLGQPNSRGTKPCISGQYVAEEAEIVRDGFDRPSMMAGRGRRVTPAPLMTYEHTTARRTEATSMTPICSLTILNQRKESFEAFCPAQRGHLFVLLKLDYSYHAQNGQPRPASASSALLSTQKGSTKQSQKEACVHRCNDIDSPHLFLSTC